MVCTFSHLPCMQPRQGEGRAQSHWAGLGFHTETWPCPTWYRSLEKKRRVVPFPHHDRAEDSTRFPGGPVGLASARAFTSEAASSHPLWPTCHLKQGPWVGTRLGTGEHLPPWPPPRPVGLVDAWPVFVVKGTMTRSSQQPSKCGVATFRQALPQSAFLGPSKCLGLLRPPQRRPLCALGKVAVPLLCPRGFRADRRQIAPLRAPGV